MIHEVVAKFFIKTLLTISGETDYESIKKWSNIYITMLTPFQQLWMV